MRMRGKCSTHSVCVCVCVVFYLHKTFVPYLNMAMGFMQDFKNFQLTDTASFVSSSTFRFFSTHGIHFDDTIPSMFMTLCRLYVSMTVQYYSVM